MDRWLIKTPAKSKVDSKENISPEQSPGCSHDDNEAEKFVSDAENIEDMSDEDTIEIKKRKLWRPKLKPKNICTEFPWLDEKLDYPFCTLCLVKITGGKFHLKRHAQSSGHKKKIQAAKTTVPIAKSFLVEKDPTSRLIKRAELKMAVFLCLHNLPFVLMDHLPTLQKNVFSDSKICEGIKMKRKKATQLIVGVLAPYFQKLLIEDLKIYKFAVIVDEATDISTEKSLLIVVRYYKDGSIKDRILNLIKIENANAEEIFKSITNIFDEHAIPYNNIIAFASDGASTMMGRLSGVQAKFKEICPHIYVQVCLCHALHLCSSAATKKMPDVVEQFARDVYSYFAHSSKRIAEMRECQIFAKEKPHKMLHPSQTRWLSLKAVVDRMIEHWASLTLFFQRAALEDNLPNAKSILNALNNPVYKFYMFFLSYILDVVNKVNIELQSEKSKFPILHEKMTSLYKSILKNFIRPEIIQNHPLHQINVHNPHNYLDLNSLYCGARFELYLSDVRKNSHLSEKDIENFYKHVLGFYIELSSQIKKRFNFSDKYLLFAANFSPAAVKSGKIRSIATFVNLFPQIDCNIEYVNNEWQMVLDIPHLASLNNELTEFWNQIFQQKNSLNEFMFLNLKKVVSVILTLPHSSAAAERGFSQLALNKTKTRNSLLIKTCAGILIVKDYITKCVGSIELWEPPQSCLNYIEANIINIETDL